MVGDYRAMTAGLYNGGPGGPILVVTNSANPFTEYYAEILLAEGLNYFALTNISAISSATLAAYDVVIVGEMTLTTPQVTTFSNWVNSGGHLIVMRPDKKLAGLLGVTDTGTTLSQGYLLVNASNGPGAGIVSETMQYHGTADRYTLGSAVSLATLYSNATNATVNPAVTLRSVGSNGGQAAAFTYDLARSIVYTRQGNPAWAGQERDGFVPMRSDDLFFGPASFDPQPDWINLDKVAIPQADEQQRLLANLILSMEADKNLLPRFWYFPHGYEAVVVMTGDDHASLYGGSYAVQRFNRYLAASPPGASVDDWEAPRCTAYIFLSPSPSLTNDTQVVFYQTNGFEINLHLTTDCTDYTPAQLAAYFTNQLNQLMAKYPSVAAPVTHRIHCIAWSGYTAPAEVGRQFGIRLETSYYHWPETWVKDRPGFMTGSGMPMRFAAANGSVIDVYQATTQMTDESGQSFPHTIDTLLDRALGPEGYYGAFVANMHTDANSEPQADAIFASAVSRGVPIISARQLLNWLDARNQSSIRDINWTSGKQTFSVSANASARGLQAMVPIPSNYQISSITWNGEAATNFYVKQVKGIPYVLFPATNGNYEVSYALDTTPPSITSTAPTNGALDVRLDAKVSVTFSEAMKASAINTDTILLRDSTNAPVLATVSYDNATFTATLSPVEPLAQASTYTAIVRGGAGGVCDLATNLLADDLVWAFATTFRHPSSIGNDKEGGGLDLLWYNGAWINACRFQAASNMTVTGIEAKVTPVSGHYKCAIYTDDDGQPRRLLGSTFEVSDPADGWQAFPLMSSLVLTNGAYYWLAICSDDINARVYYSDSEGTLAAALHDYGPWPDPISASWGGSYNYCIYAYGATGPVATNLVVGVLEDTTANLTLLGGGSGTVSYAILTNPTNGTLGSLDMSTGAVSYIPSTNYFGADSFVFAVSAAGQQAMGTVSITVSPVNDAPIAISQSVTNGEDESFGITLVGSDVDGSEISYVVLEGPTNGILSGVAPDLVYRGTSNYYGPDRFTFAVNDGSLTSEVATVTIQVTSVNDMPVANDDDYSLGGGGMLDIPAPGVLTNDSDLEGGGLTAILVNGPFQGLVNMNPAGGFTYTPTNHFSGVDSFTYQASDGEMNSGPATVSIMVSNPIGILSVVFSNNLVTVAWTSIVGQDYRLQYKDNVASADWSDILPDVRANGTTAVGTNSVSTSTQRLYRVKSLGQ